MIVNVALMFNVILRPIKLNKKRRNIFQVQGIKQISALYLMMLTSNVNLTCIYSNSEVKDKKKTTKNNTKL